MDARTYYDSTTGQIITSVQGSIEYLDLSQYEQYPYIDVFGSALSQYVQDGVLVDMPAKPNPESTFDYNQKRWLDLPLEVLKKQALTRRAAELSSSDWTQFSDVSLPNKQAWAVYRQELRDITKQTGYPTNVVWPTRPE